LPWLVYRASAAALTMGSGQERLCKKESTA
jgi:hypothetical protein